MFLGLEFNRFKDEFGLTCILNVVDEGCLRRQIREVVGVARRVGALATRPSSYRERARPSVATLQKYDLSCLWKPRRSPGARRKCQTRIVSVQSASAVPMRRLVWFIIKSAAVSASKPRGVANCLIRHPQDAIQTAPFWIVAQT
ncbi:MAG: hypothetical protein ABSE69_19815 [Roseiarcus sp.]|jgi:hypothetical protein